MPFPNTLWKSLLLLTLVSPSFGALYTAPSQLPQTTYDYIIVGGKLTKFKSSTLLLIIRAAGTAGNVVANRLSEKEGVSVLVLEAGVTWVGSIYSAAHYSQTISHRNEGVDAAIIPLLGPSLVPNTLYDWNYTTTAQKGYADRVIPYSRGRMLGGSSSVSQWSNFSRSLYPADNLYI